MHLEDMFVRVSSLLTPMPGLSVFARDTACVHTQIRTIITDYAFSALPPRANLAIMFPSLAAV